MGTFTKRIVIERYPDLDGYAGMIEGEAEDGQSWIMWLDELGHPQVFWPERDETGAVQGPGIPLTIEALNNEVEARRNKLRSILEMDGTAEEIVTRLRRAVEASEKEPTAELRETFTELLQKRAFGKSLDVAEDGRPAGAAPKPPRKSVSNTRSTSPFYESP